ncbi:MAG TPA: NUDIX hydrolase, partial [Bacteroidales bacterium]|nr:NUDIX hydrolase [Bacteroidales bacterium]
VFSNPSRVGDKDLEWINRYYHVNTTRVVTVAYYALLKLDHRTVFYTSAKGAEWKDISTIDRLAMDHKEILSKALKTLNKDLIHSPVAFEMLPKKFTIRELEILFMAILGVKLDSRNFRKKIAECSFIVPTGDKEVKVAHKPAAYYYFDKNKFLREEKKKVQLKLINWNY